MTTKTKLLQVIKQQQKDSLAKGYLKGVFASQRFHVIAPYIREDENIFFSSAIAYTLQEHLHLFTDREQKEAKEIIRLIVKNYPRFRNFKGGKTYNFFKTNPMGFFPNGKIMQFFKFFKLADDADDTSYIYLTDTENKNHSWLKKKLIKHANGTLQWNLHKQLAYKDLKTYNVYFGKNMPIETDACVLTNILLWSFKQGLSIKKQDKDSITYLLRAITSKDYIECPYLISPCYPTTGQICYHVSRLIKKAPEHNIITTLAPILIDDLEELNQEPHTFIDEVFYHISLLNLGVKPKEKLKYELDKVLEETSYFYTSIPLMIYKLWVRKLQKYQFFNFFGLRTKCDAYTTTLLLEYELLYKNHS